jgi:glycosyltransferase involved in cell wall biosynthesis/CMP-N-acetylneuraminic acid synthetase
LSRPKVSVYIPCHDYGRYLDSAIRSVFEQTYKDWELVVIDDGSSDETGAVAREWATRHPERVRLLHNAAPRGLQACANMAIEVARGDYVIRLDADDFFDESALHVLAGYLDEHPDVGLVYPNYTYVDDHGTYLGVEYRKKIGKEVKLLDLPSHGACTMVRKRILKSVGGYNETYAAQDGHELWLKVLHRSQVANVSTPLFFYRQHSGSISRDEGRLLSARREIKKGLAGRHGGAVAPRAVAIIPAKNTYPDFPNLVLEKFAGRALIDYTIEAAQECALFDRIFVTTDDVKVLEHCRTFEGVLAALRPLDLTLPHVRLGTVFSDAVQRLEDEHGVHGDILVALSVHSPLRRPEHIKEAVNTLILHGTVDNVISVYEDADLHFTHGEHGLEALNKGMLQRVRLEREALYVDNGAINAMWRDVVTPTSFYGRTIGHVLMPMAESFQIRSEFTAWLVERILAERNGRRRSEEAES